MLWDGDKDRDYDNPLPDEYYHFNSTTSNYNYSYYDDILQRAMETHLAKMEKHSGVVKLQRDGETDRVGRIVVARAISWTERPTPWSMPRMFPIMFLLQSILSHCSSQTTSFGEQKGFPVCLTKRTLHWDNTDCPL
jgi:hypothetical protein